MIVVTPLLPAQEPPPATAPGVPVTSATPPAASVLENTGKPIRLPLECTADDIQAAGLACTDEDPCPVYLELTNVFSAGSRIFLAGNLHGPSVTLFSTLLGSEDGGRTWRELHERIRGATLDRIQFADAESGWAAGETVSPLPQDPFLLVTTDGGKTWRQRFVFGEDAEDHMGAIQQFTFTDRSSGTLIIDRGQGSDTDRYELYESADGGESWGIRQSSQQPLRLRTVPAPVTEWRLHVDRASRSFQVQRRHGSGWTPVASFLVKTAVCKP